MYNDQQDMPFAMMPYSSIHPLREFQSKICTCNDMQNYWYDVFACMSKAWEANCRLPAWVVAGYRSDSSCLFDTKNQTRRENGHQAGLNKFRRNWISGSHETWHRESYAWPNRSLFIYVIHLWISSKARSTSLNHVPANAQPSCTINLQHC